MSRHFLAILLASVAALAVLAGCGGGDTTTVTVTTGPGETKKPDSEPASEQAKVPRGKVGDTLTLLDDYEQDGVDKDEKLAFTLIEISEDAKPNGNPYSVDAELPAGYRFIRLKVSVTQEGETENGGITTSQISAVDSEDQAYSAADGEVFEPPLVANGSLKLPPGESRMGYVGIAVPKDAKITQIEVEDSGYAPPSTAIWELD